MEIKNLLKNFSVEFVDSGQGVAKGNINIQCPWCGESDSGHHMGVHLQSGMYGCWRNSKHRGRKFSRLLTKVAGISPTEARRLCGEGKDRPIQEGDLENAIQALSGPIKGVSKALAAADCIEMDPDAKLLTGKTYSERRATSYLYYDRGFRKRDVFSVCKKYQLHYAAKGEQAQRIVIPIFEDEKLITYLGRSIYPQAGLRYKALDKEKSIKQVKDCIYNYDQAKKGGRFLFIVEGALDVMKLDFYTNDNHCSVGIFNMNLEEKQEQLFYNLKDCFDEIIILLDAGQVSESMELEQKLAYHKNVRTHFMIQAKDPGELTPKQIQIFIKMMEERNG